jgi:hypothetical protein
VPTRAMRLGWQGVERMPTRSLAARFAACSRYSESESGQGCGVAGLSGGWPGLGRVRVARSASGGSAEAVQHNEKLTALGFEPSSPCVPGAKLGAILCALRTGGKTRICFGPNDKRHHFTH